METPLIRRVFGDSAPPVTAFKGAFGHLIAAAGIIGAVVALAALRRGIVPGIATLRELDPDCASLPVSVEQRSARSAVGLILSRGFGGTNAALLIRAAASGH